MSVNDDAIALKVAKDHGLIKIPIMVAIVILSLKTVLLDSVTEC